MGLMYTFRFDDISLNTNPLKLDKMIRFLRSTFKPEDLRIMLAVSTAVHDMRAFECDLDRERTFPAMFHVESDYRVFYKPQRLGIPDWLEDYRAGVELAGHGMIHVDHRLLPRRVQELSIVMSCSLLRCTVFVPPFHKWNTKTEAVCAEHAIMLVKYDSAWRHLAFHKFDPRNEMYYLHTHDFHYQDFCARFPAGIFT